MARRIRRRQIDGLFDDISKKAKEKYRELAPKAQAAAKRAGEAIRDVASKAKKIEDDYGFAIEFSTEALRSASERTRGSCISAVHDVKAAFASKTSGDDKFNQFSERNPKLVSMRGKAEDAVSNALDAIENKCIIGGSSLSGTRRHRR